jgi:hypothetical protein
VSSLKDGADIFKVKVPAFEWLSALAISPDGKLVVAGGGTYSEMGGGILSRLRIWRTDDGSEVPLSTVSPVGIAFDGSWITSATFSTDDNWLAVIDRASMYLADLKRGTLRPVPHGQLAGAIYETTVAVASFSPDSQTLVYGEDSGLVRELSLSSGREVYGWQASDTGISALAFSPNGDTLATVDLSGLVKLWNARTHKLLASIVEFTDGTWAVTDAEGRYDAANPGASIGLHWVVGNRVIELQQLKKEFYTPGLLARVMKGEHLPDVTGMDVVALPPVLSVAKKFDPATKQLQVQVKNDGGGIGKLLVSVNGRLLSTVEKPGTAMPGEKFLLHIDLKNAPFVDGDNAIRVTAYEAGNRIESREALEHYVMAPTVKAPVAKGIGLEDDTTTLSAGRFYAIVVGTSTFGDPKMNLTFPARDAESFSTGLRLGAERLYGKNQVWMRVLTSDFKAGEPTTGDGLPTKANIRAAFDEVRRLAKPEDTLVVYLSGHGAMSSKNRDLYYYLTTDARTFDIENDPTLKGISTVSSDELFEWLREPVKTMPLKQVVILDTCAAGGASETLAKLSEKREISSDQQRAIELLKDATGTFILMGSAADSVSYEASKYGEGLLTYALLQGMRGESLDDGSQLGVSRWFEKASEDTVDLAKSIGGIQKPVIAAPKGTGFPVALLTPEDRAKIPLAMPKPQLLRVVCEDENQDDPLNLRSLVREQLRALNYAQARGDRDGAEVMYLDATDDDLPGALQPKLRYQVLGDKVSVRIRLTTGKDTIADQTVSASAGDTQALAKSLAQKIVTTAVAKR